MRFLSVEASGPLWAENSLFVGSVVLERTQQGYMRRSSRYRSSASSFASTSEAIDLPTPLSPDRRSLRWSLWRALPKRCAREQLSPVPGAPGLRSPALAPVQARFPGRYTQETSRLQPTGATQPDGGEHPGRRAQVGVCGGSARGPVSMRDILQSAQDDYRKLHKPVNPADFLWPEVMEQSA